MVFKNRQDAANTLSEKLKRYKKEKPLVLGIARGGFVIAKIVAKKLGFDLDVIVVRKIGAPFEKEFAIGAVSENGVKIFNQQAIKLIPKDLLDSLISDEEIELKRRTRAYRGGKSLPNLNGRTVIIADDGLATGLSAMAAIKTVKQGKPKKIILAVPVCAKDSSEKIKKMVDDFVCLIEDKGFTAVGTYYRDFPPVEDNEIIREK